MAADGESVDALYDRLQNLETAYEQQREELQALKQQREAGLLARMQEVISQLDPSLDRRETLKTAGLATAYVASGASLGAAATYALTQPAAADAVGGMGTKADPWQKVWTHELGVGDGATAISLASDLDDAAATPTTLIDQSVPAWIAQVGTSANPVPSATIGEVVFSGPSNNSRQKLLDTHSKSSTGSNLAYDSGTLEDHSFYVIWAQIGGQGAAQNGNIDLTVNNDTTANYRYNEISAGAVSMTTGASQWREQAFEKNHTIRAYLIRGDVEAAQSGSAIATMRSLSAADPNRQTIINGNINKGIGDVNSVQLSTSYNATAEIAVYGLEMIV